MFKDVIIIYFVYTLFSAKRRNLYYLCGKLFAISLCNGGGAGNCLAPCVYNFIAYGESNCLPSIDDVQDPQIKNLLQQVIIYCFMLCAVLLQLIAGENCILVIKINAQ